MGAETGKVKPSPSEICAVVVTFYPGDGLSRLFDSLSGQVAHVVVVDNHSAPDRLDFVRAECRRFGCHLIENEANLGIARALNLGAKFAMETWRCEWLIFYDQDTRPHADQVARLLEILAAHPAPETVGVIGSNYIELPMGNTHFVAQDAGGEAWMPRDFAITSGCLVSRRSLEATGGFRDEFFIDCVDFDYSFRARVAGYETVVSREPLMAHTVGSPLTGKIGRWRFASSNHRPERRYYRVRNIVVLLKEHLWKHPRWVLPRFLSMIKSVILMLLIEKQRPRKIRYVLRGLADGLRSDFHFSPLSDVAAGGARTPDFGVAKVDAPAPKN